MSDVTARENGEWTFARLLGWTVDYLARQGVEDSRLCGEVLLAHAAGCARIDLYVRHEETPTAEVTGRFRDLVKRAAEHEPIAYLVGEKEFYSLAFSVSPAVLIPRPETETLVDAVLDHCKAIDRPGAALLDVGTGSGCIAVTLLIRMPEATALASDISEAAIEIARSNAERHDLLDRMTLVQAPGLDLPSETIPDGGLDVIVSNPPYIATTDMATLDETVRAFEPHEALTDGADGLSVYRAIATGAAGLLTEGGIVAVEIAMGAGDEVKALMTDAGLTHRTTVRDQVGGHDRVMVFARD